MSKARFKDKVNEVRRRETAFDVEVQQELMPFLIEKLTNKSRNTIKNMLRLGQVVIDGISVTQYNHILEPGNKVVIELDKPPEKVSFHGLKIIFEDEHIIVIDKKEGMLSIATDKVRDNTAYSIMSAHVKRYNPQNKIFVIHRLDRETSGIMMFAKSPKVQKLVQESWGPTTKERTYMAVVQGKVDLNSGTHISYLVESKALIVYSTNNEKLGQLAITHYEKVKENNYYTLLKLNLETGRKNQIRVHMQDMGHPIIGDEKYGATKNPIGRLGLHALSLAFEHPITKELHKFESPIPSAFLSIFNK
jgi:23S rRNA pseudouridine1911/1915/1917 synthase